jgi:hypothetical protein
MCNVLLTFQKNCTLPQSVCMYVFSRDSSNKQWLLPQGSINQFIYVIETFCASYEVETIFNNIIYMQTKLVVLDGQEVEFRRIRNFRPCSDRPCGETGSVSHEKKRSGRGVDHPPLSCAEVKEEVELYLLLPLWAFFAFSRVNFNLYFYLYFTRRIWIS